MKNAKTSRPRTLGLVLGSATVAFTQDAWDLGKKALKATGRTIVETRDGLVLGAQYQRSVAQVRATCMPAACEQVLANLRGLNDDLRSGFGRTSTGRGDTDGDI